MSRPPQPRGPARRVLGGEIDVHGKRAITLGLFIANCMVFARRLPSRHRVESNTPGHRFYGLLVAFRDADIFNGVIN